MIAQFQKSTDQKELYFQISAALKMQYPSTDSRLAGIYAIYNGDTCLYVGQSQNLASRVATHLCSKFEQCTHIDLFLIDSDSEGFSGFYSKSADAKKSILEYNEKCFIRLLHPIENINADHTFQPENRFTMTSLYEAIETDGDYPQPNIVLKNVDCGDLSIISTEDVHDMSEIINSKSNGEQTVWAAVERVLAPQGFHGSEFCNKAVPLMLTKECGIWCVIRGASDE